MMNPLFKPTHILFAALSLSIGWGIRGNYGHEFGAMLPGALTAIAVCLLSGRQDWRQRVAYFAFFGAVGWGLGGSFSYMQVVSYTHSGHRESVAYGFAMLFVLGYLWASLGGAGTALPAVLERRALTELFKPLGFIIAAQIFLYFFRDGVLNTLELKWTPEETLEGLRRHERAFYWLDSDWLQVLAAIAALLVFDVWNRRGDNLGRLALFVALGAVFGFIIHRLLSVVGLSEVIADLLTRHHGDSDQFEKARLVTNWPLFLTHAKAHIGWGLGAIVGVAVYFCRYGKFRCGSSLFLHMCLGWFAVFLLLPVLLGLRMTEPRGDNWAGVLGLVAGAYIYFLRSGLRSIVYASVVCGLIGGIGFSGMVWLKLVLVSFGNPNIVSDPAVVEAWQHWQHQNWHSFLEQSYGFVNGVGVAIAMALLVNRTGPLNDHAPRSRWTEGFAIFFALPIVIYVNMVKNVNDWTRAKSVPASMHPPLIKLEEFFDAAPSALFWFNSFAWTALVVAGIVLWLHCHRPLGIFSMTWLGRGQLAYFLLLWVFTIGNATKAIVSFHPQRLLTEWVILMNALICTLLLFTLPEREKIDVPEQATDFRGRLRLAVVALAACFLVVPPLETAAIRAIYRDQHAGHAGQNFRFGERADWRVKPLLRGEEHR